MVEVCHWWRFLLQRAMMLHRRAQVPDALHLSRATFRKIQQNLAWAFAYNCLALPLAAGACLPRFNLALTPSISGGTEEAPWLCFWLPAGHVAVGRLQLCAECDSFSNELWALQAL